MARNGSGVYSLPSGNLAVSGQTISSTKANALWQDLEADMNVDRPIVAGGTGASTAADARTNLGLAIGSDVQAYDAGLASISGLTTAADRMIYTTASDTYAVTPLTAFARSILDDADAASVRATIGAGVGGGDLVASNNLSDLANATTARTNLGVAIGSNVQAYDAGLADIAGLAVTDGNFIVANGSNWIAESGATARTSLGLGSLATLSSVNNGNWSGTDLAVANGGTGASDAATARTNLGAYGSGDNVSFGTVTASGDVAIDTDTLFVDVSTARVGINTSSPDYRLQVNGSVATVDSFFYVTSTTNSAVGLLRVVDSGGNNAGQLAVSGLDGLGANASWNFQNTIGVINFQNSGDINMTGGGNVGIGTSSPGSKLDVNGTISVSGTIDQTGTVPTFNFNETDAGTDEKRWRTFMNAGVYNFESVNDAFTTTSPIWKVDRNGNSVNYQTWSTGGSERMRIDSSGNVGIGTSSPATTLDVRGSGLIQQMVSSSTSAYEQYVDSASAVMAVGIIGGAGYVGTTSSDVLRLYTVNSERLRIDTSGNVGIGTSSPGAKFDVNGEMRAYAENNASVNGTLVNATHLKGAISGLNGNVTVPTATAGANGVLCGDGSARTITRGSGLTMYVNGSNVASATLAARGVASVLFTTASVCYVSGDVS